MNSPLTHLSSRIIHSCSHSLSPLQQLQSFQNCRSGTDHYDMSTVRPGLKLGGDGGQSKIPD